MDLRDAAALGARMETRHWLDEVLDVLLDPLLFTDADGRVRRANRAAGELLGRPPASLARAPLDQIFDPVPAALRAPERAAWMERGERLQLEAQVRGTRGARLVSVAASALRGPEGAPMLVLAMQDLTDQRRAEELLAWKAQELARSNAELEQFAYAASHDLQEPLRKIRMFGDLLRQSAGAALGPEARDFLERMQRAGARMSDLIDGLLAYSRVSTHGQRFERVDLRDVAEEVLGDLEFRILESGVPVCVGPLPAIEADPLQMRRLLQNLLANALKFRKPGQRGRVELGSRDLGNGFVEVFVADDGLGFDERFAGRLFKPFQRLHSEVPGTGMGLAICYRIAVRHGGLIRAQGAPGRGARFTVTLPMGRRS